MYRENRALYTRTYQLENWRHYFYFNFSCFFFSSFFSQSSFRALEYFFLLQVRVYVCVWMCGELTLHAYFVCVMFFPFMDERNERKNLLHLKRIHVACVFFLFLSSWTCNSYLASLDWRREEKKQESFASQIFIEWKFHGKCFYLLKFH